MCVSKRSKEYGKPYTAKTAIVLARSVGLKLITNLLYQGYKADMKYSYYFIVLLGLCGMYACDSSASKNVNEEEAQYTTSDASELFFKNVRSIYYDKTVMDEAKLDVYKIKERLQAVDYPLLNLSIVVNWRYDEAYVLTEPNDLLRQMDTIRIVWQDTTNNQSGQYEFVQGNKDAHFKFATQLYRSLSAEHQIYLLDDGEKVKFMNRRDAREPFRKTMVDYFRLVDLL